jgi:hypothetical protein
LLKHFFKTSETACLGYVHKYRKAPYLKLILGAKMEASLYLAQSVMLMIELSGLEKPNSCFLVFNGFLSESFPDVGHG